MIPRQRFPRANADIVTISREVWDNLVAAVEYCLALDVAAPLQLMQTPAAPLLSIRAFARGGVLVRITATEDGGGKYRGVLLTPPTAPTDSDAIVSQDDLGDVGEEIYIINTLERDRDTHDLSLIEGDRPKEFIAVYRYADPTDGLPTYAITGFQVTDCDTPDTGGMVV